jgi:hypothetical protein
MIDPQDFCPSLLSEMLQQYRDGERGMPSYDDLAALLSTRAPLHIFGAANPEQNEQLARDAQAIVAADVAALASGRTLEKRMQFTEQQISIVARSLSDSAATECGIDKDDAWNIYSEQYLEEAEAALAKLSAAAPQVVADEPTDAQLDELQRQSYSRNQSMKADTYAFGRACYRAALQDAPVQASNPVEFDGIKTAPVQAQEPVDWQKIALYYNDLYSREKNRVPVQPVAVPDGKQIGYAVYGISGGKQYLHDIKMMSEAEDGEWKSDNCFLDDYWAGNEPVFLAAPAAQGDAKDLTVEDLYCMYRDSYGKLNCEVDPFDTLDEMEQKAWRNLAAAIAAKAAS